jgi:hypothetical protein
MKFLKRIFNLMAFAAGILSSPNTGGRRLKYGAENLNQATVALTMDASVTAYALSAQFVSINTSGNGIITTASNNYVFGFAIGAGSGEVSSSTAGTTLWATNVAADAIYRIPINTGTYVRATYRGTLCDLSVASNIQGAALATNTKHHLCILDGDEVNNYWAIVRINPAVLCAGQQ